MHEPSPSVDRRAFLAGTAALAATVTGASTMAARATTPQEPAPAAAKPSRHAGTPWPICLDTATIRPVPLLDKIRIAAEAGYDAIEPWESELADHERSGGNLKDLGKLLRDRGLRVPSVIGLWNAIPETQDAWDAQLPASRDRMRMASAIGAEHIQVIPQPERPRERFDPAWAAARYRDLLEMGIRDYQLVPAMVFVKFLPGARTLGQAAQIAIDSGHPQAKVIPDTFHMFIGGTPFGGLQHLRGEFIAIFQFNDAPAAPGRDALEDRHRVYPGDGVLPLRDILRDLKRVGYTGCVSLELYNEEYWKQDPSLVARTGLEKTLAVIRSACG
jgi:sugar phosphate isomerase/epimerase